MVYVCHFARWPRYSVVDAPRPSFVFRDKPRAKIFSTSSFHRRRCLRLTHGTFRVFMIGILDAAVDETLFRVPIRYQGVPIDNGASTKSII